MIERDTSTNIGGQFELADLIEGTGNGEKAPEGYDANGALIKPAAEALPDCDEARLTELATEINAITEQTRGVVISAALAVGKRLVEAKSICPEGRFGEWLEHSVSYSERKAQDMMRLYVEYGRDGAIPDAIAALDYSKAVALLSAPAEAREELAERAQTEELSVRALNDEIKRLKAEKLRAQMSIDDLTGKVERARDEIARLDEREQTYDAAIVKEREAARIAEAKATAAESSANELRKLHSDAEDRAAKSAQRASDAVQRANQTAKDLAEARQRIAELEEAAKAEPAEPEERIVEVVPEAVQNELADLRRQLAEAKAAKGDASSGAVASPSHQGEGMGTAVARFRDSYKRLTEEFKTAEALLAEIVKDDAHTGQMYATAMVKSCRMMIERLGE